MILSSKGCKVSRARGRCASPEPLYRRCFQIDSTAQTSCYHFASIVPVIPQPPRAGDSCDHSFPTCCRCPQSAMLAGNYHISFRLSSLHMRKYRAGAVDRLHLPEPYTYVDLTRKTNCDSYPQASPIGDNRRQVGKAQTLKRLQESPAVVAVVSLARYLRVCRRSDACKMKASGTDDACNLKAPSVKRFRGSTASPGPRYFAAFG